jgi:hypothetical protein
MGSGSTLSGGHRLVGISLLVVSVLCPAACNDQTRSGNSNSRATSAIANNNSTRADTLGSSSRESEMGIEEPDRFSIGITISVQAVDADPGKMPTLQFGFSKFDSDRRWAFSMAAGQVVYLEKSGLMYVILADRKQYLEIEPDDLGVRLGRVLSPRAIAEQLKGRASAEALGVEPVNSRTARKYRFKNDAPTAGEGAVYVDIETGLPVRAELNTSPGSGKSLRIMVEGRDIQLNPDRALFEVPAGMKKISMKEAKQSIDAFAGVLRSFSDLLAGSPAALPQAPFGATNKNAPLPHR